jgi:hypothetical protein
LDSVRFRRGLALFSSKTKTDNLFDKKLSYTNQINF